MGVCVSVKSECGPSVGSSPSRVGHLILNDRVSPDLVQQIGEVAKDATLCFTLTSSLGPS